MNHPERITNWINNVLTGLSNLNNDSGIELLKQCGKDCCKSSELFQGAKNIRKQFRKENNDNELFAKFKAKYYNSGKFTKKGKIITLIFEECTCPLVKSGVDNLFLCNCTIGYSKHIFETLFDKKVSINLEKSILRGNSACVQKIKIIN